MNNYLMRTAKAEQFAKFYGITIQEAETRVDKWDAHTGDPTKPICMGCARMPHEIDEYVEAGLKNDQAPTEYVIWEEGTYNGENGHFLCTNCYVKNGMPSSSSGRGWVCP